MPAPDEFDQMAADVVPVASTNGNGNHAATRPRPPWPEPMHPAARYGIAGEFIELVEHETEADPAALLVQFLVAVGNAIGHGPYWQVGATRHHANLFTVLVGETAAGRKGTALDEVLRLVRMAAPDWRERSMFSGIGSGEVLVHEVRDERVTTNQKGETQVDAGVTDKRLLTTEAEFGAILGIAKRDGSTLSQVLRRAWDSGDLRTTTKTAPATATGAHISLVGHITAAELHRKLDQVEISGGLANRVLWCCARRARMLPFGGHVDDDHLDALAGRLADVIDHARHLDCEVRMSADFREAFEGIYPALSTPPRGLLGDVLNRAAPMVRRLAMIYALLDRQTVTGLDHLRAAVAVWAYCEASARHIFGDGTGDRDADRIHAALLVPPHRLNRRDLSRMFSNNRNKEQLDSAVNELVEAGIATREKEETTGRGRPAEWVALISSPSSLASFDSLFVQVEGEMAEAGA